MTTIDYLQAVRSDGLHTGMVHRHKLEVFLLERFGDPDLLPQVRELAARATQ
jgi:hypothetical protein